ncbi:hypothetical protein Dimus_038784 [Dionaea muscipula]
MKFHQKDEGEQKVGYENQANRIYSRGRRGSGTGRGRNGGSPHQYNSEKNDLVINSSRGRYGRNYHHQSRPRGEKSKVQCYNCKRYGHYSYECYHNEKTVEGKVQLGESQARDDYGKESTLLMASGK